MRGLFFNCSNLVELNLSNFNTNKTKDMFCMFSFCSNLKDIKISLNFNIEKVDNLDGMFLDCININLDKIIFNNNTKLGIKNIKSQVTFKNINQQKNIIINAFKDIKFIDLKSLFYQKLGFIEHKQLERHKFICSSIVITNETIINMNITLIQVYDYDILIGG